MRTSGVTAIVLALFCTCAFFILTGCAGGGSTGTGLGNSIDAGGVIVFLDGTPASGITVHAETDLSDDTQVSDASGRYTLKLLLEPGKPILFTFDNAELGLHWEREITDIPAATRSLTVSWQITAEKHVTPVATEFFDADGNRLE